MLRLSHRWRLYLFLLAALACVATGQRPPASPPPPERPVIQTGAQEVLLDLIVRDKKGRTVRDLEPGQVQVYEEGALQKISGFRLVTGTDLPGAEVAPAAAAKSYDPLRQLRLVSLVFESLDNESRRMARQAALEFLKNPLEQNVYMGVFMIDQRLYVLQHFTNDRIMLRKAIERATTQQYTEFAAQSDAIRKELEQVEKNVATAGTPAAPGRGNAGTGSIGTGAAAARMAQMTLNILRYEENLTRDQQARSAIFSLFAIIKEQAILPGRKTLIYFSEGLTIPEAVIEQFRSVIGAANRAGVSVYGVDARGLTSDAMNTSSTEMLASAAQSSARQQSVAGESVTPDQAKVFDTLRDSIHANRQQSLDELSTSTGGFMIANTNDYRVPFRKLAEDIQTYYELTYVPHIGEYDGRFRKISVKVNRPDVRVQTRSGYYALPPGSSSVLSYEIPLLRALEASPLPHAFPLHGGVLRFESRNNRTEYAVVIEVPMQDITFTADASHDRHRAHLALLALIKDGRGEIVQRFGRDVPILAPADKLEAFRRGRFTQTYHADLPPGRYVLESAVMDYEGVKASARRVSFVVPNGSTDGVRISSLSLIRRIEPDSASDPGDPFHFSGGRVVPTLDIAIESGGRDLSYYFVVYPLTGSTEKPKLTMEFLRDGELVAKASPELPAADDSGRIRYVASLPLASFKPGNYELHTVVRQGTSATEERAVFLINP